MKKKIKYLKCKKGFIIGLKTARNKCPKCEFFKEPTSSEKCVLADAGNYVARKIMDNLSKEEISELLKEKKKGR